MLVLKSWKKLAILNALIVLFILTTVMGLSKNQQQSSLRMNSNPSNSFGTGKSSTGEIQYLLLSFIWGIYHTFNHFNVVLGVHSSGARGKYAQSSSPFSSSENTQRKATLIDSENGEPVYVTPNITELFETIRKRGKPWRYRLF